MILSGFERGRRMCRSAGQGSALLLILLSTPTHCPAAVPASQPSCQLPAASLAPLPHPHPPGAATEKSAMPQGGATLTTLPHWPARPGHGPDWPLADGVWAQSRPHARDHPQIADPDPHTIAMTCTAPAQSPSANRESTHPRANASSPSLGLIYLLHGRSIKKIKNWAVTLRRISGAEGTCRR